MRYRPVALCAILLLCGIFLYPWTVAAQQNRIGKRAAYIDTYRHGAIVRHRCILL